MTNRERKLEQAFRDRPVPVKWGHVMNLEWFRQFTFRERLKLLFGHNVVILIGLAFQHNPGRYQPYVIGRISDKTAPDEYMKAEMQYLIDTQPNLPIKQELEK